MGDYLTSQRKEKVLVESAKSIVNSDEKSLNHLVNYQYDIPWITETSDVLALYSAIDTNFPNVALLVSDTLDGKSYFLEFNQHSYFTNDTILPAKKQFIRQTTQQERDYLNAVFEGNNKDIRFSAHGGRYELFYPYEKNNKKIVLYFSEYQRYGKIGS